MKNTATLLLAFFGLILINSCGHKAGDKIANTWTVDNIEFSNSASMPERQAMESADFNKFMKGITYLFRNDGTYEIRMNSSLHRSGNYRFRDEKKILILENKFQVIEYEVLLLTESEMKLRLLSGGTILVLKAG